MDVLPAHDRIRWFAQISSVLVPTIFSIEDVGNVIEIEEGVVCGTATVMDPLGSVVAAYMPASAVRADANALFARERQVVE
jgi:hypothetical protein